MNVLLWALLLTPELTKPDNHELMILFMAIVCGLYLYAFGVTVSDMAAVIRRATTNGSSDAREEQ